MNKVLVCPKCGESITSMYCQKGSLTCFAKFDGEDFEFIGHEDLAGAWECIVEDDIGERGHPWSIGRHFCCPECGKEICETEEEARALLPGSIANV